MAGDEPDDPIADARNIIVRLRYADHNACEPHRVDRHGGARHDERPVCRHRERHADGMPAAENDARRRLAHSGNHLGKAEPRFNVAADGVEQYEQCADILCFLYCGEQRHDVLVLGRFRVRRQHHMSFDLPDDRISPTRAAPSSRMASCSLSSMRQPSSGEVCRAVRICIHSLFVEIDKTEIFTYNLF